MELILVIIFMVALTIRMAFMVVRYIEFCFAMQEYLQKAYRLLDRQKWMMLAKKCSQIRFDWTKALYLHEWGSFDAFVDFTLQSVVFWQVMDNWNNEQNREI